MHISAALPQWPYLSQLVRKLCERVRVLAPRCHRHSLIDTAATASAAVAIDVAVALCALDFLRDVVAPPGSTAGNSPPGSLSTAAAAAAPPANGSGTAAEAMSKMIEMLVVGHVLGPVQSEVLVCHVQPLALATVLGDLHGLEVEGLQRSVHL